MRELELFEIQLSEAADKNPFGWQAAQRRNVNNWKKEQLEKGGSTQYKKATTHKSTDGFYITIITGVDEIQYGFYTPTVNNRTPRDPTKRVVKKAFLHTTESGSLEFSNKPTDEKFIIKTMGSNKVSKTSSASASSKKAKPSKPTKSESPTSPTTSSDERNRAFKELIDANKILSAHNIGEKIAILVYDNEKMGGVYARIQKLTASNTPNDFKVFPIKKGTFFNLGRFFTSLAEKYESDSLTDKRPMSKVFKKMDTAIFEKKKGENEEKMDDEEPPKKKSKKGEKVDKKKSGKKVTKAKSTKRKREPESDGDEDDDDDEDSDDERSSVSNFGFPEEDD